jgi:predicted CoA-binding protein
MTAQPSSAPATLDEQIAAFLAGDLFAVAGASTNRTKYGNRALRAYIQAGRRVIPINPHEPAVEGLPAYRSVLDVPEPIHALSIVTPPPVTEKVVRDALHAGIMHLWMQPGAESPAAITLARSKGASVIAGDACILVVLGYREH